MPDHPCGRALPAAAARGASSRRSSPGALLEARCSFLARHRSILAKVRDVVQNNGDNLLVKNGTSDGRGSIIHLRVDFDENRPIVGFEDGDGNNDDDEMFVDQAATAESERNRADMSTTGSEVVGGNEPNDFTDFDYIFGSDAILNEFNDALLDRSDDDALRLCVNQWKSPGAGFECVYGALFELRCHRKFENETKGLKLRMRIVFNPKKKKPNEEDTVSDKWVTLPVFDRTTIRYRSNDPSILSEDPNIGPIEKNQYLLPPTRAITHHTMQRLLSTQQLWASHHLGASALDYFCR